MNKEITREDFLEIARQIVEGFEKGIVDSEGYRISWSIKIDKFEN